MPISASGIGSGIDINSIVTQLMATERRPLDRLKIDQTALQSSISASGKIASSVSAFQDAVRQISTPEKWQIYQTSSSNEAAATATASSAANEGDYSLSVSQLAKGARLASATVASPSTIVGTGTLSISIGNIAPGTNLFTIQPGKTAVNINVGDGSLTSIRDAINAAAAGVSATIVNTGTGSKLVVTSKDTGAQNAIKITAADNDGNHTDATGLSSLAFDPELSAGAGKNLDTLQSAQDALLNVNGISVASASNTSSTIIDGLTLTLKAETTAPVSIRVSKDTAAIKKSVDSLVSAYNTLQQVLKDQTKYVEGAKNQVPLQGDSAAVSLLQRLRSTIFGEFTGQSGDFNRLSDAGVAFQKNGALGVDQSKWNAASTDLSKLARLFSVAGTPGVATSTGFAKRLDTFASEILGTSGTIASRTDGLGRSVKTNQNNQASLETRLAQREARLRLQYQAMDSKVAGLQALGTSVTQQLSALQQSLQNRN